MTTQIERYLNSLSEDILSLHVSNKNIKYLPDLTRFKNLKLLHCYGNQLSSLPKLPKNLKLLNCSGNKLTYLHTLPENLETLYCSNNELTNLPKLSENLKTLYYYNNPIYEIVNSNTLFQIKKNIQILNNFRHLYYCLKFKKQLRKWLWEKVREPYAMKKYSPLYLIKNLRDEDDLDTILDSW